MKEFTTFYEKKVTRLREEHTAWVSSNMKMRSIETALRQIKSVGDIDISPAEAVLREEYKKEKVKNDKLCSNMYCLRDFVLSMEAEAKQYGVEWSKVIEIFGY